MIGLLSTTWQKCKWDFFFYVGLFVKNLFIMKAKSNILHQSLNIYINYTNKIENKRMFMEVLN